MQEAQTPHLNTLCVPAPPFGITWVCSFRGTKSPFSFLPISLFLLPVWPEWIPHRQQVSSALQPLGVPPKPCMTQKWCFSLITPSTECFACSSHRERQICRDLSVIYFMPCPAESPCAVTEGVFFATSILSPFLAASSIKKEAGKGREEFQQFSNHSTSCSPKGQEIPALTVPG